MPLYLKKVQKDCSELLNNEYLKLILTGFLYIFSFPNEILKNPVIIQGIFPFLFFITLFKFKDGIRSLHFFLTMTVLNFFLYIWLVNTIHEFGGISLSLSVIGVMIVAAYVSAYYLLFLVFIKKCRLYIFYPPVFLILELIRGYLFTGFTFNLMGYSLYKLRFLILPARFFTVYGVGFFIVFLSMLLVYRKKVSSFLWVFILVYFIPALFITKPTIPDISISVVQTSFAPEDKRVLAMDVFLKYHYLPTIQFLQENKDITDLVVWSETAIPFKFSKGSFTERLLLELTRDYGIGLITGSEQQEENKYYNSALFINKDGGINKYHKMHLVPFGEFFPFRNIAFFDGLYGQFVDFSRGTEAVVFEIENENIFVPICYEIAFGSIVRKGVNNGANVIVNISNDAWYGFSSGPVSEIPFSVFRAIESNVWVLRAINRGWGVVVDPNGKILYKNDPRTWGIITLKNDGDVEFHEIKDPIVKRN